MNSVTTKLSDEELSYLTLNYLMFHHHPSEHWGYDEQHDHFSCTIPLGSMINIASSLEEHGFLINYKAEFADGTPFDAIKPTSLGEQFFREYIRSNWKNYIAELVPDEQTLAPMDSWYEHKPLYPLADKLLVSSRQMGLSQEAVFSKYKEEDGTELELFDLGKVARAIGIKEYDRHFISCYEDLVECEHIIHQGHEPALGSTTNASGTFFLHTSAGFQRSDWLEILAEAQMRKLTEITHGEIDLSEFAEKEKLLNLINDLIKSIPQLNSIDIGTKDDLVTQLEAAKKALSASTVAKAALAGLLLQPFYSAYHGIAEEYASTKIQQLIEIVSSAVG